MYKAFYEPIKVLSLEDKGRLLDAIFEYQISQAEPSPSSPIYMVFLFFKNQFRLDTIKYNKTVQRNQENGKKGGRPSDSDKPKEPSGLFDNPSEPKKADNDNDNGKDNGKDNGNETDNDINGSKKNKQFIPPLLSEIETYCKENGYTKSLAEKIYKYYSENDWKDGLDKPIKNWKQKLQGVWFTDKNNSYKESDSQSTGKMVY